MTHTSLLIIDDRRTANLQTHLGNTWYLVTDDVMGGVSQGDLSADVIAGRKCLHMQGDVKLENNGGFVQAALNLTNTVTQNIESYNGLMLLEYGNDEQYNIHLRTTDLSHPWQSYRTSFRATATWQTLYFPFSEFKPHRTDIELNLEKLKRIGLVGIGRAFHADLCVATISLYVK